MDGNRIGDLAKYHERNIKEKQTFPALDGFKKTEYHEAITDIYSHWVDRNAGESLYGHTFKPDKNNHFTLMREQNRILSNRERFTSNVERTPSIEPEQFYQALYQKIPNLVLLLVDIYPKLDRLEKINMSGSPFKIKTKQFITTFATRKDLFGRICKDLKEGEEGSVFGCSQKLYHLHRITKNYLDLIVKIHTALKNQTDIDSTYMKSMTLGHLTVHSKILNKTISPKIENSNEYTLHGFSFLLEVLTCAEYNLGLIQELFRKI